MDIPRQGCVLDAEVTGGMEGRAAGQLAFLQDLQRLLDEEQFVASYKFALLMAIA